MQQYPITKDNRNVIKELQCMGKQPGNNYYHTYSQSIYVGRILTTYSIIKTENQIEYSYDRPTNSENLDPIIQDLSNRNPIWWLSVLDQKIINGYAKNGNCISFDIDKNLMQAKLSLNTAKPVSKYIKNTNHPKVMYFNLLNSLYNEQVFNHNPIDLSSYNEKQQLFITSPFKLTTLTAVAGSGKTTTIVGKTKQLLTDGINENEILLTTFTKNAAKELSERTNIKAYTIDSITLQLLKAVYNDLSIVTETQFKILTGINTDISNKDDLFVNVMEKMNNIEKIVNDYKMITYEVATIMLIKYILYGNISAPFKHIVIDEAQDTSLIQMILMLTIAYKNNASVSLIGDEAQSLYEFRNAVPQLMHEFKEKSTNYILDTNYRSTDEVLSFATKTLNAIPGTDITKINGTNKHGNNITVSVQKYGFDGKSIEPYMAQIQNQIANGESVCILTSNSFEYTTGDKNSIISKLQTLGPVNILTSERFTSILETIEQSILDNWDEFTSTKSRMPINIINKIKDPSSTDIQMINSICGDPANTNKVNFIKAMINYELAALDALNQTNEQKKASKCLLNIGTIHAVKGMEFDHTYIFIDETNKYIRNELPQFYKKEYVAFTRARISQHIVIRTNNSNALLTRV